MEQYAAVKKNKVGTSLVVQWSRVCLPMQETQVWSLAGELRSHKPRGAHEQQLESLQLLSHGLCFAIREAWEPKLEKVSAPQRRPSTAKKKTNKVC